MKYDVFISYRRNGGEHTAKIIRDRLADLGYKVFFDVESLRSGNFNTKLYSVIDECSDFVLILSPDALDRCSDEKDWVRREVEYALSKNKNVVPVLLRDFKFDTELPEAMKVLPQLNGIEANSEFFDAFIEKLQKFLKAKPSFSKLITQNSVVKKTIPLFISIVLILGIVFGVKALTDYFGNIYPRTNSEKNLTQEVVYYVGTNLTCMEIIADSAYDAIDAIERQIYLDSSGSSTLAETLAVCRQSINNVAESTGAPEASFTERLSASAHFNMSDIIAMHDEVINFKTEWLGYIDFLEYVVSDLCYFSKNTKAEILDNYKAYLDENLNMYACVTNMIFINVTNKNALDDLHSEILTGLVHIPLNSQNWSTDSEILKNNEKECYNKINAIFDNISVLTGNISVQTYKEAAAQEIVSTTQPITTEAYEDTKAYQELIEKRNKLREMCLPEEGDSYDTLWVKLMNLIANEFYDDARDCVDACREAADDPNADTYLKSVDLFIDLVEKEGLMYGCLVVGYYEPDGISEIFEIGDIIVSIDGKACRNLEEYTEIKSNIDSDRYKLEVLRANDKGELERVTLNTSKDSPRVYIYDLVTVYE